MTGQACEVVTNLHLSPFHSVAASWVETGQNQSLFLFLNAFLEEIGLKHVPSVAFFVEETGLNHACSEFSLPVVTDEDQVNVFYLMMMSQAFFWWLGINLAKNQLFSDMLVKLNKR